MTKNFIRPDLESLPSRIQALPIDVNAELIRARTPRPGEIEMVRWRLTYFSRRGQKMVEQLMRVEVSRENAEAWAEGFFGAPAGSVHAVYAGTVWVSKKSG